MDGKLIRSSKENVNLTHSFMQIVTMATKTNCVSTLSATALGELHQSRKRVSVYFFLELRFPSVVHTGV